MHDPIAENLAALSYQVALLVGTISNKARQSAGEQGPHLARSVEKHVRWFWRIIMCPLLFGIIGTQMNFNNLPSGTIPKAVAIIFAGGPSLAPCFMRTYLHRLFAEGKAIAFAHSFRYHLQILCMNAFAALGCPSPTPSCTSLDSTGGKSCSLQSHGPPRYPTSTSPENASHGIVEHLLFEERSRTLLCAPTTWKCV